MAAVRLSVCGNRGWIRGAGRGRAAGLDRGHLLGCLRQSQQEESSRGVWRCVVGCGGGVEVCSGVWRVFLSHITRFHAPECLSWLRLVVVVLWSQREEVSIKGVISVGRLAT